MIIALRKSAWQNATQRDRTIFRYATRRLQIFGQPALYETAAAQEWLLSADSRLTLKDLADLGKLVQGIKDNTTYKLPLNEDGSLDVEQLHTDMEAWLAPRVVWPVDLEDVEDPYAAVLAAQNAPAALQASGGIPDGLTPVETP